MDRPGSVQMDTWTLHNICGATGSYYQIDDYRSLYLIATGRTGYQVWTELNHMAGLGDSFCSGFGTIPVSPGLRGMVPYVSRYLG